MWVYWAYSPLSKIFEGGRNWQLFNPTHSFPQKVMTAGHWNKESQKKKESGLVVTAGLWGLIKELKSLSSSAPVSTSKTRTHSFSFTPLYSFQKNMLKYGWRDDLMIFDSVVSESGLIKGRWLQHTHTHTHAPMSYFTRNLRRKTTVRNYSFIYIPPFVSEEVALGSLIYLNESVHCNGPFKNDLPVHLAIDQYFICSLLIVLILV